MTNKLQDTPPSSEIVFYQTQNGKSRIEVRLDNEMVWLSQRLLAELYEKDVRTINEHIRNIYEDGERESKATIRKFRIVQPEGQRHVTRSVDFYNLDMILAVGYRVRSHRGTQFRRWATERLHEYLVKGFAMDDERLKQAGGGNYFDELLARIRDIRSSEKIFWRKVLDIYATSIDYDPNTDHSRDFFAVIQNKMHWAAHGHTATEIIASRVNSGKSNIGLTSWSGARPNKKDIEIAKNYLNEEELDTLNRIVTMYLDFAELQALNRNPMYMRDWIGKLDDFLRLSEREILSHAGTVSHQQAMDRARIEYEKYHAKHLNDPSPIEKHFSESIREMKEIEARSSKLRSNGKRKSTDRGNP